MSTIAINQIKNKVKTHGVMLTVYYCAAFAVRKLIAPYLTHIQKTFSQAGEDIRIDKLLGRKKRGFYVDVGAHHPVSLSNTKRFYDRGWVGINLEPNPKLHQLFTQQRSEDINICCGAGSTSGVLDFYEMEQAALSSFDPEQVCRVEKLGGQLKRVHQIPVRTLNNIFAEHVDRPIDFMSIDIEGLEEEVLLGNDWLKWRPTLICVEACSDENVRQEPVLAERDKFFEGIEYRRVATTRLFGRILNAIYEDKKQIPQSLKQYLSTKRHGGFNDLPRDTEG